MNGKEEVDEKVHKNMQEAKNSLQDCKYRMLDRLEVLIVKHKMMWKIEYCGQSERLERKRVRILLEFHKLLEIVLNALVLVRVDIVPRI